MPEKTPFEVTEKAGLFVAGQRSPGKGKQMMLTEAQAFHALRLGELTRLGEKKPAKPPKGAAGGGTGESGEGAEG